MGTYYIGAGRGKPSIQVHLISFCPWKVSEAQFIFLPVLDYGDLVHIHVPARCLQSLDSVYHAALTSVTSYKALTHHCTSHGRIEWPQLAACHLSHWYTCTFIASIFMWLHFKNSVSSNDRYLLKCPQSSHWILQAFLEFTTEHPEPEGTSFSWNI